MPWRRPWQADRKPAIPVWFDWEGRRLPSDASVRVRIPTAWHEARVLDVRCSMFDVDLLHGTTLEPAPKSEDALFTLQPRPRGVAKAPMNIWIPTRVLIIGLALLWAAEMSGAAAAEPEMKFDFTGKLVKVEQVNLGRGAAAGRFSAYKLGFEVVAVKMGDLKPGQIVPCEQSVDLRYETEVKAADAEIGKNYRVRSPYKHPAHAEGLYLLECRLALP